MGILVKFTYFVRRVCEYDWDLGGNHMGMGNGNRPKSKNWELEGIGIDCMGMGRSANVKIRSMSSLLSSLL